MNRSYNNFSRIELGQDPIFRLFVVATNQAIKDLRNNRLGTPHKTTAKNFLIENADIFQRVGIPTEKIQSMIGGA